MNDKALVTASEQRITTVAHDLASRLRYMVQNGRKLDDQEVYALAQYCAMTDLNPFAAEAYYIPGVGPTPGVAGWRKKANEQLLDEARRANEPGAHFWVEFIPCESGEAMFDVSKGDVAYKAVLRDWLSNKRWRTAYFDAVRFLREVGDSDPLTNAYRFSGPEPVWEGVGVVYADEVFSREGKREKFDRHERAKKRAEKIAIRKRFQAIHLPEPEGADVDYVEGELSEPRERLGEGKIMENLGFGEEQPQEQKHADANENVAYVPLTTDLRYSPEQLMQRIKEIAAQSVNQSTSSEKRGLVVHCLEGALSFTTDPEASRKFLTKQLTGYSSTRDMPDSYVLALYRWLNPHKDSGGDWVADEMAQREASAALSAFMPEQESLLGES